MALKDVAQVKKILKPFPKDVTEKVLWLRELIWKTFPEANELIYDNYNAVAIGWSPTEKMTKIFCSLAVYRTNHNIHCGFYWGSKIKDPKKMLLGKGKQYRYLLLTDVDSFPVTYVKTLMREANVYSLSLVKDENDLKNGQTILKSVSATKR